MQKFHGNGEFPEYVLSRITKIIEAHIRLDKKRQTVCMGEEQQDSFEEIKCSLIKPPVWHMPNTTGRFHLYSDTSKFATGSVLYQITEWQTKTDSLCQ